MAEAKSKVDVNRKVPINTYLKTTKLSKPIKVMMGQLYKGKSNTLDNWEKIDENTNNRRCK